MIQKIICGSDHNKNGFSSLMSKHISHCITLVLRQPEYSVVVVHVLV